MEQSNPYKVAYERERASRLQAEKLLDEKSRSLFENYTALQKTLEELKLAQDNLIQSEKMASIGQLAAGVAHEINNPIGFSLSNMTTLSGYIESILSLDQLVINQLSSVQDQGFANAYREKRKKEDIDFLRGDIENLLTDSIKGLNRVSDIVKSLKKVTHASSNEWDNCNLNDLIEESIKVVWNELKYSMQIERDFGELPLIQCHEGEIHQVMMNLFINAAHACEENLATKHGVLSIKTFKKLNDGQWFAVIDIRDNGKGMSDAVMKRIFDPFFTTKPVGVGTGLGLSISFGVIQRHGGKILVSSKENTGTCFQVLLPLEHKRND